MRKTTRLETRSAGGIRAAVQPPPVGGNGSRRPRPRHPGAQTADGTADAVVPRALRNGTATLRGTSGFSSSGRDVRAASPPRPRSGSGIPPPHLGAPAGRDPGPGMGGRGRG